MEKTKKWTGRKIAMVIILYLVGLFFLIINRSSFAEWGGYVTWLYLIYAVGNVGTKVTNSLKYGEILDFGLSRKLVGFIVLGLTGFGLMFLKDGVGNYVVQFNEWTVFMQNVFFIYIGGNVGDKFASISNKLILINHPKQMPINEQLGDN